MVKPHERNTRYVDAVMTIPKVDSHFNLCIAHRKPAYITSRICMLENLKAGVCESHTGRFGRQNRS